jgi:hypothetical protein
MNKDVLNDFLSFYGCPAVVLPESQLSYWHGMLLATNEKEKSPDFIAPSGASFVLDDTMDFDHPKTDYDRICQKTLQNEDTHALLALRQTDSQALVLNIVKSYIRWEAKLQAFVWLETVENKQGIAFDLQQVTLDALEWQNPIFWEVPSSPLVLFNSSFHGEDFDANQFQKIEVREGLYQITSTRFVSPNASYVFVKMQNVK